MEVGNAFHDSGGTLRRNYGPISKIGGLAKGWFKFGEKERNGESRASPNHFFSEKFNSPRLAPAGVSYL